MPDIDENIEDKLEAQLQEEINRLAGLPEIKYEQERTTAAKQLEIRASVLDRLVKQARLETAVAAGSHDELVAGLEPWPQPVNGSRVADEMVALLKRYTVQPNMGYESIALWCVGTYVYDSFRIYPRLCLHSPQKRCGKTTTLELIEALVYRALIGSNVSASVIFRAIEAWRPTILADEADTWIHGNEELRGIINSGHNRRTARVFRTEEVDGQRIPVQFSTWAPLALAMIHTPPDTIMDRSVVVNLRRKTAGEVVEKIPVTLFDDLGELRSKLLRWALDNADDLRISQPVVPETANDRAQDNWHSLFAIADALGGQWISHAKSAMTAMEGAKPEDEDIGAMLLMDIYHVFEGGTNEHLFSEELVEALVDMESRPWCEWRRGQPMTKNSLAKLLKPYRISSVTTRKGHQTKKGYKRSAFADAFSRYIPPIQNVTTSQASNGEASSVSFSENQNVTQVPETSQRHTNDTNDTNGTNGTDGDFNSVPF